MINMLEYRWDEVDISENCVLSILIFCSNKLENNKIDTTEDLKLKILK